MQDACQTAPRSLQAREGLQGKSLLLSCASE